MQNAQQKFEIRLTNTDFIPKLNFKKAVCIGKGTIQNHKLSGLVSIESKRIFFERQTTTVAYELWLKAKNNPGYVYGTTTDEHDSAKGTLWFRSRPQATTVHLGNLKQFQIFMVTPGSPRFFREHQGPGQM